MQAQVYTVEICGLLLCLTHEFSICLHLKKTHTKSTLLCYNHHIVNPVLQIWDWVLAQLNLSLSSCFDNAKADL